MCVSLVAAMIPNKAIISQNFPGTNLPPRDTVKEGGAPTLSDGKPGCGGGGPQSPNLPYSKGVGSPVVALPLAVSSWSGRSLWSVKWELQ